MAGSDIIVKRMWSLFTTTAASAKDALRTLYEQHNLVILDLEILRTGMETLAGTVAWNPSLIADGNEEAKDVTVTGAVLGDFCLVSMDKDVKDLVLDAQVISTNNVTCILANNTGGNVTIDSGNVFVRVIAAGTRALVDAAGDLDASTLTTPESGD